MIIFYSSSFVRLFLVNLWTLLFYLHMFDLNRFKIQENIRQKRQSMEETQIEISLIPLRLRKDRMLIKHRELHFTLYVIIGRIKLHLNLLDCNDKSFRDS